MSRNVNYRPNRAPLNDLGNVADWNGAREHKRTLTFAVGCVCINVLLNIFLAAYVTRCFSTVCCALVESFAAAVVIVPIVIALHCAILHTSKSRVLSPPDLIAASS